jgi:hypothetical protein
MKRWITVTLLTAMETQSYATPLKEHYIQQLGTLL